MGVKEVPKGRLQTMLEVAVRHRQDENVEPVRVHAAVVEVVVVMAPDDVIMMTLMSLKRPKIALLQALDLLIMMPLLLWLKIGLRQSTISTPISITVWIPIRALP